MKGVGMISGVGSRGMDAVRGADAPDASKPVEVELQNQGPGGTQQTQAQADDRSAEGIKGESARDRMRSKDPSKRLERDNDPTLAAMQHQIQGQLQQPQGVQNVQQQQGPEGIAGAGSARGVQQQNNARAFQERDDHFQYDPDKNRVQKKDMRKEFEEDEVARLEREAMRLRSEGNQYREAASEAEREHSEIGYDHGVKLRTTAQESYREADRTQREADRLRLQRSQQPPPGAGGAGGAGGGGA